MCRRGEIYNVDFGNNENSYKQCGVRPALVVSNNRANENSPVVTVVPLTARVWKKKYLPTHVQIPLKASVGSVSYTHLDVYKRQSYYFSESILSSRI